MRKRFYQRKRCCWTLTWIGLRFVFGIFEKFFITHVINVIKLPFEIATVPIVNLLNDFGLKFNFVMFQLEQLKHWRQQDFMTRDSIFRTILLHATIMVQHIIIATFN